MATHLRTELILDALNMAIYQRRPQDVIHHSDQGTQYTSIAFGARWKEAGIRPSMGSVGDCFDNALCESFFATLECELLDRSRFPRLHRGLVQPASSALVHRLLVTRQLREEDMSNTEPATTAMHGLNPKP